MLHKNAAGKLIAQRDKFQILLMKIKCQDGTYEELSKQFQSLMQTLDKFYEDAPRTTDEAVEAARIALNITIFKRKDPILFTLRITIAQLT